MKQAIAYIRVSTEGQLQDGAGLDLQMIAINAFAQEAGYRITQTFRDVQSGFGDDPVSERPGAREAIRLSKKLGCPIIVAGLSRFSRNVDKLEELVASGKIKIISTLAGDGAGRAVVMAEARRAQAEVERIRRTTKEGLERARARGAVFGNPKNLLEAQQKGAAANKTEALQYAREIAPAIAQIRASGKISKRGIAAELNGQGLLTRRGQRWNEHNLRRLLERVDELNEEARPKKENVYVNNPLYGMFG